MMAQTEYQARIQHALAIQQGVQEHSGTVLYIVKHIARQSGLENNQELKKNQVSQLLSYSKQVSTRGGVDELVQWIKTQTGRVASRTGWSSGNLDELLEAWMTHEALEPMYQPEDAQLPTLAQLTTSIIQSSEYLDEEDSARIHLQLAQYLIGYLRWQVLIHESDRQRAEPAGEQTHG